MYKGSTMKLDSYAKDINELINSVTIPFRNEIHQVKDDLCEKETEEEKEVKKFAKNYIIR